MLGAAHGHLGNMPAAIHCSEQAVSAMPSNVQALDNLALGYQHAGEIEKACAVWERRLSLTPNQKEIVSRLARGLMSLGKMTEAGQVYRRYLSEHPGDHELLTNLGNVCELEGALSEAEKYYRQALDVRQGHSLILQNLANVLSAQGRIAEAIDIYRRSFDADPENAVARSNYLLNLHYEPGYSARFVCEEHVNRMKDACSTEGVRRFDTVIDAGRPIRVGFVSPDMRTHSVAYFLEPLLEAIDRQQYPTYCYADVSRSDEVTQNLRELACSWCDISGKNIAGICGQIRRDNIDILIDLAGHTSSRNMEIFSARPAPVQITWLGYPDTTGLECMDYRFTDEVADPIGSSMSGTEELVRLDGGFLCYKAPSVAPDISILPAKKNGFVTFGSFNNLAKINDHVLELWVSLLKRVDNSRLYIKNPSLTDEVTRNACREKILSMGIGTERVSFVGRTRTTEEHLQLYSNIDIGLDTFPYNGTTTTCEGMWMGVPVVTRAGSTHAGRVGMSLLKSVSHPEWIGQDDEVYLQIAAGLAGDIDVLSDIRTRLRDEMRHSRLCDSKHFALHFGKALRNLWERYCQAHSG